MSVKRKQCTCHASPAHGKYTQQQFTFNTYASADVLGLRFLYSILILGRHYHVFGTSAVT